MTKEREQEIFQYIKEHIQEKGFPPSIREICKAFNFSSPRAGQKYLEALEEQGYIKRESKSRGIKVLAEQLFSQTITLPFLGYIAAGAPIEVVEEREEMDVPAALVGRKPCYILQVKGNSMIEDHILNGDFIVVEKCDTADDGEVVVALINRESATLKRMYREKNRVRLEPANSTMKPIYVKDVAVQGTVRGLFRKF
ncbi:repressor LexA [candidate division WOR-1 bacterium RIFOXYB2_FULL_42_35]|uniref:LexA repressor n=1 Tax=candidate division WOR-1 bacterium RIFOXYC2_FULL_41_25 TaxID=1802586 RepID=A0A1F4TRR7_UNCSA|nr:MAG: repressor LexA [candidate division WOR-1 bacterium RIFOXYA2_FULL_41_14]OGC27404.1 MAG: repressor LexA [candidate division WOR-1 bacterium RIFOXYB2_FULL_42_35]OGC35444.1 MAG: repressor LexA [candidate division WOR-1 bacterium RIFOXYC2_FULL_41_25]